MSATMSANRVQRRDRIPTSSAQRRDRIPTSSAQRRDRIPTSSTQRRDPHFLSPTQRRLDAVALAETHGDKVTGRGRCSACVQSNSVCWVLEGQSMCGACRRKNKTAGECDGVFSRSKFDDLEAQRLRALAEAEVKEHQLEALFSALRQNRQDRNALRARAQMLREQQRRMLSRELAALDEIDSSPHDELTSAAFNGVAFVGPFDGIPEDFDGPPEETQELKQDPSPSGFS